MGDRGGSFPVQESTVKANNTKGSSKATFIYAYATDSHAAYCITLKDDADSLGYIDSAPGIRQRTAGGEIPGNEGPPASYLNAPAKVSRNATTARSQIQIEPNHEGS